MSTDEQDPHSGRELLEELAEDGTLERVVRSALWAERSPLDSAESERLAARAYARIAFRLRGFRGKSRRELIGWIKRLSRSAAIDDARAAKRYEALIDRFPQLRLVEAVSVDPVAQIALRDQVERLLRVLRSQDRKAIEMRYLQGISYEALGKELGVTEVAAALRVRRAMARLRETWHDPDS